MTDPQQHPTPDCCAGDFGLLPESLVRQIRLAPVPAALCSIFSHLPHDLVMEVRIPAEARRLPRALCQLLKISRSEPHLELRAVRQDESGEAVELRVSHRGTSFVALGQDLESDVMLLACRILAALLSRADVVDLIQLFALQSTTLATLQTITRHMLEATDVDKALYVMLSGITSGYGLGFNRAALFINDEERLSFQGSKAIGPRDRQEAHRIWEDIELSALTIDDLIRDYDRQNFDTRLQQHVQESELSPGDADDDELRLALASGRPRLFQTRRPVNSSLRELGVAESFVLATLRTHGKLLGLVLVDNLYTESPIGQEQLRYLEFFIDQTSLVWENLELLRSVAELARIDGLTGLLNRREFDRRLEEESSRSRRSGQSCSLLIVDVDRFKQINDERGHAAGDEVLRKLGQSLLASVRAHDLVGRYGGDELVVFLTETDKPRMVATASRIGRKVHDLGISISLGGASWPADCPDPAELLSHADALLYRAKDAGRGRGCFEGGEPVVFGQGPECSVTRRNYRLPPDKNSGGK